MAGTDQHKLTGPEYPGCTDQGDPSGGHAGPALQYPSHQCRYLPVRQPIRSCRQSCRYTQPGCLRRASGQYCPTSIRAASDDSGADRPDLWAVCLAMGSWQQLAEQNLMPQLLNRNGYVTQLICDCPHLFNAGFNRTFNGAFQVRGRKGDIGLLHMNDPIVPIMPREKTRTGHHFQDRNLVDLHRWTNRYPTCEAETFPYRTARHVVRWLEETTATVLSCSGSTSSIPTSRGTRLVHGRKYDPAYAGTPMLHPTAARR